MARPPVKGRTYQARKSTGNYATSKRQKGRTLKSVTGGFQRLKDFERKVSIPVAINTRGSWPIGNDWQAMTKAEITAKTELPADGGIKAAINAGTQAHEYADNCGDPAAVFQTSFASASGGGQSTVIPPSGFLASGSLLMCEPMKWQQQHVLADGTILQQNPDHAGAAAKGCQYVGLMTGQRCMYGYLKFALRFVHNIQADKASQAHPAISETPVSVRFTVIKLRGKLVDDDGDIRDDFKLLKPFPVGSKYTKLYDTSFTLSPGGHKAIDMTLGINQWMGRKAGIYEDAAAGMGVNDLHHRNDPRYLGGDVKGLTAGIAANGAERRIEPFCEWSGTDMTNPNIDQSSYNTDTSRILVLMTTSDDAIGGLFGPVRSTAAEMDAQVSQIACAGYITACAYDEK